MATEYEYTVKQFSAHFGRELHEASASGWNDGREKTLDEVQREMRQEGWEALDLTTTTGTVTNQSGTEFLLCYATLNFRRPV